MIDDDGIISRPIDYLDERYPTWLTKVLNIGEPIISATGPDGSPINTAAIGFAKDGDGTDFQFYMNPEFAASLNDEERAFLMSHEAMHVVRNDMAATLDDKYEDKKALNMAMDYIVNDTLTNAGMQAPEWALQGKRDLGMDCEGMDLDEIYGMVMQNPPPPDQGEGEGEGEGGEGEGEPQAMAGGGHAEWDEEMAAAAEGESEDAEGEGEGEGNGDGDDDEEKPPANFTHGTEQTSDQANRAHAADPDNKKGLGHIAKKDIPNIDYEELFRRIEPTLVDGFGMGRPPRNDWRQPKRSMMSVYPQAFIPAKRDDRRKLALASKRMVVIVGIDNSGSVSAEDVALFRSIAERLPKSRADYIFVATSGYPVEVPASVVFDPSLQLPVNGASSPRHMTQIARGGDAYMKRIDIPAASMADTLNASKLYEAKHARWRGGLGIAEFDSLEIWIQAAMASGRLREYPKSVLMISDAESFLSCHTEAEHADRWTVLVNQKIKGQERGPSNRNMQDQRGPTPGGERSLGRYGYDIPKLCSIPPKNFVGMPDLVLKDDYVKTKARV